MNVNKSKSRQCLFCEKPIHGQAIADRYCKKLVSRVACQSCSDEYEVRKAMFGKPFRTSVAPAIDVEQLTRTAQQNTLFTEQEYSTIRVGQNTWRVTGIGAGRKARIRLKDNLEQCACQHKATRHINDADGNLLHCRDCDCDHFWYAVPQIRSTDLVVLSLAAVTAEPTVIDKLEAVTLDRGATEGEVIAAQAALIKRLRAQQEQAIAA